MRNDLLLGAVFLSLAIPARGQVTVSQTATNLYYIPCPQGYQGQCGDIPGVTAWSASSDDQPICPTPGGTAQANMSGAQASAAAWLSKVQQTSQREGMLSRAISREASAVAAKGYSQPSTLLNQTASYINGDLQPNVLSPLVQNLTQVQTCLNQMAQSGVGSDGCYHGFCNAQTVEGSVASITAPGGPVDLVTQDLASKKAALSAGLPNVVLDANNNNVCASAAPQVPCASQMNAASGAFINSAAATTQLLSQ